MIIYHISIISIYLLSIKDYLAATSTWLHISDFRNTHHRACGCSKLIKKNFGNLNHHSSHIFIHSSILLISIEENIHCSGLDLGVLGAP